VDSRRRGPAPPWSDRVMVTEERLGLSVWMTRRLESVLLITALVAVACTLALTSVAAGLSAFVR
jgi:hypothetical protein